VAGARFPRERAAVQSADAAVAAQAAEENFPVALRLLPSRRRRYLMAVYVFARTVDNIGDRAPVADRFGLLAEVEEDLRRMYEDLAQAGLGAKESAESTGPAATGARVPAVQGLRDAVADCAIPMQPFVDLIEANREDQVTARYQTFADLLGYCRLSANPVGRIVLYVFGSFSSARAELSDSICTALQLAEHWQDVAEDFAAGRIYLPGADLAEYGCTEADLGAAHASARLRRLLEFEVGRASSLLDAGAPLIGTLRGAARLAVAGYLAGGRAALAAITAADYDVLAATPKPGSGKTLAELALAVVRGR
jgi:squalene synthase HpnC